MVAFNITDEHDAMLRHAELVAQEGGSCVMASLNWCGFSLHPGAAPPHRNWWCTATATASACSRHPALGMDFQPWQTLWRLAGVDHMHVHGLQGKFAQSDAEVIDGARDYLAPLADANDTADRVMPASSSGNGPAPCCNDRRGTQRRPRLFMAGGGILAHLAAARRRHQPAPGLGRGARRYRADRRRSRRAGAARGTRLFGAKH